MALMQKQPIYILHLFYPAIKSVNKIEYNQHFERYGNHFLTGGYKYSLKI